MKTYYDISLRDLKSAKVMLDAQIYNNAVRFCQQYVEVNMNTAEEIYQQTLAFQAKYEAVVIGKI